MPGLDYLGIEESNPNSGNLYQSFGLAAVGEIGGGLAARYFNKRADKLIGSYIANPPYYPTIATSARSGGSVLGNPKPFFTNDYSKKKMLKKMAITSKGIGRLFGIVGVAQIAVSLMESIGGTADKFRISEEELERSRYTNLYKENAYFDSRTAFTQRQRALQVIHNSRLSLKPALGQESSYLHN